MQTLLKGLHHSRYAILREVITNEFAYEIPETRQEALTAKLLPLVDSVFSIYDLSDDHFAQSPDYDLLYSELTGAVVLYLAEYGKFNRKQQTEGQHRGRYGRHSSLTGKGAPLPRPSATYCVGTAASED